MQGDINVEEELKNLLSKEGADGYVIFNQEGIPLKYDKGIIHERAVHISSLYSDLWRVARKIIKNDIGPQENDVEIIRLRTKHSFEYIVTQHLDYTIVVKQFCGKAIEENRIAQEQARAEAELLKENKR